MSGTNTEDQLHLANTELERRIAQLEETLLSLGKIMLENLGYRVLAVGTPGEAMGLAEKNADEIKLLITDVVMPEMNGRDLAERLQSLYPSMKILFMSGYTANVIVHRGVLDGGVNFIQKPFSMMDLAVKVWEALREKRVANASVRLPNYPSIC